MAQEGDRIVQRRRIGTQHRLVAERRKTRRAPLLQRHAGEGVEVVPRQVLVQRMRRVFGLDQHFARQRAAPGAPANLHELLEQALRRAKIRCVQRGIGADHPHQGELRKVVALGHHLRADQDVGTAVGDGRQQAFPLRAGARRVAVDAQHARLRKQLRQPRLDTLRTAAERPDVLVTAARAGGRDGAVAAAVVAAQAAVGQMHHQVGRTVRTAAHPAAGGAGQHRRVAPAVQEHQALLGTLQPCRDRRLQRRAQAFVELQPPGVDAAHRGHRRSHRALAQRERRIARVARMVPALQRRRGRAEHDRHAALACPPHRDIARRVAHAFLLLVGRVVLLIDQDQPQTRQRREHRQPRAEHNVGMAGERLHEAP